MAVAYVIAAAVAMIWAGIEIWGVQRRIPITFAEGSWVLWLARLALEIGAALAAAYGLTKLTDWPAPLIGVSAGAGASSVLRQRFVDFDGAAYGFASGYDRLRDAIDGSLERRAATEYTAFVEDEVLPVLVKYSSSKEVGAWLRSYVSNLGDPDDEQSLAETRLIKETVEDTEASEEERIDALLRRAQKLSAHPIIRRLYNKHLPADARPKARWRPPAWALAVGALALVIGGVFVVRAALKDETPLIRTRAGATFVLDNVRYLVEYAETAHSLGTGPDRKTAKGTYVLVKLEVRNESDSPIRLDSSDFAVVPKDGDDRGPAPVDTDVVMRAFPPGDMQAGTRNAGLLVFDVPLEDLTGLEMTIRPPDQGSRRAFVQLPLREAAPPILPKAYRGATEHGIAIGLESNTNGVKRVVLEAKGKNRRTCHVSVSGKLAPVGPDGGFVLRSEGGLVVKGRFRSTLEADGTAERVRADRKLRCLRPGRPVTWKVRAKP